MCHRASLEGSQHLGMTCLFPSLPILGLGLLLLFSVIKGIGKKKKKKRYWWLSGSSHLKRQQGPAAVAVVI